MALAIVNISSHVVSVSSFTMHPGGTIRLSAHYRDEATARRDPLLVKLIDAKFVEIREVDFDGIASMQLTIAKLEAADQERRREQKRLALEQRNRRVAARQRQRVEHRAQRQAARTAAEAESAAGPKQDVDLSALYEKNRKERLARVQEQVRQPSQIQVQTPPAPVPVEAVPPATSPTPTPLPTITVPPMPSHRPVEEVESGGRLVRTDDLRRTSDSVTPIEIPKTIKRGGVRRDSVNFEQLSGADLKKILEAYNVKKIPKTQYQMLKLVKELNISQGELEEILAKK